MHNARRRAGIAAGVAGVLLAAAGCGDGRAVLTRQIEARRVASELRAAFVTANEAGARAVLADTDYASTTAAGEATKAEGVAAERLAALDALLQSLGYRTELEHLARFRTRFEEFRRLDAEILPLASENSNLKAQWLSFGEGREAAERFTAALAERRAGAADTEWQKAAARADVLEIEALQARHIAAADEAVMTEIERQMAALAEDARSRLKRIDERRLPEDGLDPAAVSQALEGFLATNQQIVDLSRRNTNVRSLALTLGRKRVVAAECEAELRAVEETLAGHGSEATR
jgi:hypothetical protein